LEKDIALLLKDEKAVNHDSLETQQSGFVVVQLKWVDHVRTIL
jgi:hypothetical protein